MPNDEGLANSWFVLAQIFAILSGLSIVGTAFVGGPSMPIDILDKSIDVCNELISSNFNTNATYNLAYCLGDAGKLVSPLIVDSQRMAVFFLALGLIFAVDAFVVWGFGRKKLHGDFEDDNIAGFITLVANIILVVLLFVLVTIFVHGS